MKSPVKAPAKSKVGGPRPRKSPGASGGRARELEKRLAEALAREAEAREQQSATSEVLAVINRSTFALEPVLETLLENAVRLCAASRGSVYRFDGERLRHAVSYNVSAETAEFFERNPITPGRYSIAARAALEHRTQHIPDILADPDYTFGVYQVEPIRTALAVPMMKGGDLVGAFTIWKLEVEPFTDRQIEVVTTFAHQAVIAIENVRLLTELRDRNVDLGQALDRQTATSEILRVISGSRTDLQPVFDTIVRSAVRLCGASHGGVYQSDGTLVHVVANDGYTPEQLRDWRAMWPKPVTASHLLCRAISTGRAIRIGDFDTAPDARLSPETAENMRARGARSVLVVPMFRQGEVIGGIGVAHRDADAFSDAHVELLETFAAQAVIAIENARLFREIEQKTRELEAASRHKSEFLASMSHELRTPLNAILGFSEILAQGMFGAVNDKQAEYLRDILDSGHHLLSLINDILDLSKIEAGRMELEVSEFDLPQAILNGLTLVRERALRRGIDLHHAIDDRLGAIRADERKVKQVLLNLLSNALKFTPEGGRVEVRAAMAGASVAVSVADTGVGIAPEDQETVFEEFRQVGAAEKKAEGTGLGLALSRKFVELHGGRIWVESEPGRGSTFTFALPVTPIEPAT
ncbi:MAG TPA: GAF domain-containing protein [Methylomirabilota bacterium]